MRINRLLLYPIINLVCAGIMLWGSIRFMARGDIAWMVFDIILFGLNVFWAMSGFKRYSESRK